MYQTNHSDIGKRCRATAVYLCTAIATLCFSTITTLAATQLDVVIAYDTTGKTWADSNGGTAAIAANAVAKMNLAAQNSDIDVQFNLVHVGETAYTHVDLSSDLTALQAGSGNLAAAHTMRETYSADLVALLVDTGSAYGTVGIGYMLSNAGGSPAYAFTVNAIRSVEISHTLTHEVGHNLGAHHSKNQTSAPGPNTNLNSYSAGWYFTGVNAVKYHTIMAYNNDGYGNTYTEAPLFSTPLISYQGTAAGHAADGDNARTIRETMDTVAGYRVPFMTVEVPYSQGFENSGSMPPDWRQQYVEYSADWTFQNGGHNSRPPSAKNGSYNAFFFFAHPDDQKTKLISPLLNFGNKTNDTELTFWHYMEAWDSDQDELRVFYRIGPGGVWNLLETYTATTAAWTFRTISLPNPNNTYQIAFEGNAKYGYGVCIDDVTISGTAPEPAASTITVTPAAHNIAPFPVGTFADTVFVVSNAGAVAVNGAATVSNNTLRITGGGSYSINPGTTHNVTVRFAPTTAGNHSNKVYFSGAQGSTNLITGFIQPPAPPAWWTTRAVLQSTSVTNDFAAANAGQLKWLATKARDEFETSLTGGAGEVINTSVNSFSNRWNYTTANLGQVKAVAKPFYDRMKQFDNAIQYPWFGAAQTNDYGSANIGQIKNVFHFGTVDGKPWSGAQ